MSYVSVNACAQKSFARSLKTNLLHKSIGHGNLRNLGHLSTTPPSPPPPSTLPCNPVESCDNHVTFPLDHPPLGGRTRVEVETNGCEMIIIVRYYIMLKLHRHMQVLTKRQHFPDTPPLSGGLFII